MLVQQMQAKRDAAAAAAEQNNDDDDDDDAVDGREGSTGPAALQAAVRSSPSGDSFATIATENHLDTIDRRLVVSGSRHELQDRLSIHSPAADYAALHTVRLLLHCQRVCS